MKNTALILLNLLERNIRKLLFSGFGKKKKKKKKYNIVLYTIDFNTRLS